MALSYAHGSFDWLTSHTLNSTQAISGLGFQPKAIRFFWTGLRSATNASASQNGHRGVGFAVSASSRMCVIGYSADATAAADDATMARSGQIAGIINGSAVIGGRLNISSFDSDGFTTIVDEVATANLTIFWEAWGGTDITNATIGQISEPAAIGTVNYTATGFTADGTDQIVMFAGCQASAAFGTGTANDHGMCVGAATSTAAADQWVVVGNSDDGSATMDTDKYCRAGECYAMIVRAGGNPNARANLSAFGTNQFTLNWTHIGTANRKGIYLAIKGGRWKAGGATINMATVGNTGTVSGLSFAPVGLSVASGEYLEDAAGVSTGWDSWTLGCGSSSTSRRSQGYKNEGGRADTVIDLALRYDAILGFPASDGGGGMGGYVDIQSLNSDGFTLVVDDNTTYAGTAMWYGYVTFGSVPAANEYQQTCYATASGAASLATASVFSYASGAISASGTPSLLRSLLYSRLLTTTGTGAVALGKYVAKTFQAAGTGTPSLGKNIAKTFTTTGTASVSATQSLVTAVIQQCYAAATATVTLAKRVTKVLSTTATGSPAVVKAVSKTLSVTGTGAVSLTKKVGKVLTTTGAGAVAMTKRISKVLATTGTGSVLYTDALVLAKQILASASGAVTATQTFIAAPPAAAWFAKVRRTLFRYIRRR